MARARGQRGCLCRSVGGTPPANWGNHWNIPKGLAIVSSKVEPGCQPHVDLKTTKDITGFHLCFVTYDQCCREGARHADVV